MKLSYYNNFLCIEELSRDILDLDKTFDCGQCFRWNKLNDGTWLGVVNNKQYMFKHTLKNDIPVIITTATEDEFKNIFIDYFDLNTSYESILNIPSADKFALKAQKYGKGIRILKQDPWETTVSFIISQRNNIPKIKSTIDKLCSKLGEEISLTVNGRTYKNYTFPIPSVIAKSDLSGLSLGYRDSYILHAAQLVMEGKINYNKLLNSNIDGNHAIMNLEEIKGVGPKVANCIALFGLHKLDTFPIDTWMQKIIVQHYNGVINPEIYGKASGLVQQYMFYYIRFN